MTIVVSAFYKFVAIDDAAELRQRLRAWLAAHGIRGTILVAPEGINGTVSGPAEAVAGLQALLRADPRFADLATKDATAAAHPFQRTKVKLKREIISFRQDAAELALVGTYVPPTEWNALIAAPDVLLLDTRNRYEVAAGTFEGAMDPGIDRFGAFARFVDERLDPSTHRRVAMFCTGGIRCEKASAYMRARGFAEVYQLQGGVLAYLAQVPREESLWRGACYVFDERVTVD